MDRIKRIMMEQVGQDLSCFHDDFLEKTIEKRLLDLGLRSLAEYEERLRWDHAEVEKFIQASHVFYSEFYREPFSFFSLTQSMLPEIISRKKEGQEIRIWSVGCAIGQEPYSIAMEAHRLIEQSDKDLKLRIFATDISETVLERARLGRYQRADLKKLSLESLDQHFHRVGNDYEVNENIKDHVDFIRYDILDKETICPVESIFGGFDIIFCRNLMIYYRPDFQRRILEKLKQALATDGYLVTGEAEKGIVEKWLRAKPFTYTGAAFKTI